MSKIVLAATAALLLTAGPAMAREPQTAIQVSDLDLASRADAATLRRRLAAGLERVCGSYAGVNVGDMDEVTQCRRAAERQARDQLARVTSARQAALARR